MAIAILPADASPGSRFCPRCGASFQEGVGECADCGGAIVVTAGTESPVRDKSALARERESMRRGATTRRKRRRKR